MTRSNRDPAAMTAAERQGEIAQILAVGFLRLRIAQRQGAEDLAVLGLVEAQCGARVQSPQSEDHVA